MAILTLQIDSAEASDFIEALTRDIYRMNNGAYERLTANIITVGAVGRLQFVWEPAPLPLHLRLGV